MSGRKAARKDRAPREAEGADKGGGSAREDGTAPPGKGAKKG